MDSVALEISHTVFGVIDNEEWPDELPSAHTNGLVRPMSRGALIATGIHTGAISVLAVPLERRPSALSLDDWDEVVEVSFVARSNRVQVATLMEGSPTNLPNLVGRPGTYRLRVHAKGRDIAPDGVADQPEEEYLLLVWPAPTAAEQVLKASDRVGAGNRSQAAASTRLDLGWEVVDDIQYGDDPDDPDELQDHPVPG
jgi:hypothetical protein